MSAPEKDLEKTSLADRLKASSLKSKDILNKQKISPEKLENSLKSVKKGDETPKIDVQNNRLDKTNNLLDYFKRIENEPDRFSINKSTVYVDDDIHEVFMMIKKNEKVNISKLVSVILEEFILNHKEEIEKIMKPKNKFLT